MAKKLKRMLALVLAIAMVMGCMSVSAFAADPEPSCGYEEHTHDGEDCYEKVLKCGLEEGELELTCEKEEHEHDEDCSHTHDESCVGYTCGLTACEAAVHEHTEDCHKHTAECAGKTCELTPCAEEHEHTEECHQHNEECTVAPCELEECTVEEHAHTEECHQHVEGCSGNVCGLEEGLICTLEVYAHSGECYTAHTHDEDCYESNLTCEEDEHEHDDTCYVAAAEEEEPEPITGTITDDMVWEDGAVVEGVTIADDVTITVEGTVTVAGTIRLNPSDICNVVFEGENDAMLIRGGGFTGQMFYVEGASGNFQNLVFNNITLDGGAVWSGEEHATLERGTENIGIKATGSVLYLLYASATLNNSTLQNHDAAAGKANAVFLRYYSTVDFNNSVVRNNNNNGSLNSGYRGGVVCVRQGGTATTRDADVYGNSSSDGGFFGISSSGAFGGIAEAYDTTFHNNYSDNGAVFMMQCNSKIGYLLIDGCEFYENGSSTQYASVLGEWAYSRPMIIKDSYFHDNECPVWNCHTDPVLDLSGEIVIEEDTGYTSFLYETPIGVGGNLADGTVFPMSDASYNKLMTGKKHLMTEVPTDNYYNPLSKYTIVASDIEKMDWANPDNLVFVKTDVDGNGMLDVVPVPYGTTTNVTLYENFKMGTPDESNRVESQDVSDEANNIPIAVWFHEGFYFAGWAESATGAVKYSNQSNAATYAEGTVLYAIWKLQTLELKMSREDNTLKVSITNENLEEEIDYTYQWYKDGEIIAGATSAEYTISESATYKCVVTASAEGFTAITGEKSGDATYIEEPKDYVAEIVETGEPYETLALAVDDANELGTATIKMLADVYLSEGLTITGDVTIIGEYTIYRDADAVVDATDKDHASTSFKPTGKAYYWDMFTVNAGATLTLDGGIVLDGNNEWTLSEYDEEEETYHYYPVEGQPLAGNGAYMVQNNGTLNVFDATMQNQASNADYGQGWNGAINCGSNAVTTLDGATIQKIAGNDGGTIVFMQGGSNCVLNIKEGTKIINNLGGANASLIRLYGTDTLNMTGGEISNNICRFAGSAIYLFDGCTMNMSGGKINDNWASAYGEIYVHGGSTLNITGGEICGNDNSLPAIYVRSSNNKVSISGCLITGNTTDYSESYKPYNSFYCPSTYPIVCHNLTGGVYSQDVGKYCPAGYVCIPYDSDVSDYCDISYLPDGYDEDTDDADYIIVPGYKVSYYVLETNAETGEATRTLVHTEFLLIPADMTAEEAELKATPYVHYNDDGTQMIDEWYIDVEMTQKWSYDTEITENIAIGGVWTEAADAVCKIVETGELYETLAEAVADANELGTATIEMLADVYLSEGLIITGDVTIIGEYTIYRDADAVVDATDKDHASTSFKPTGKAYYWDMFTVNAGATLTLDGGIVLDGNNEWTLSEYDEENDSYYYYPVEGQPLAGGGAYMVQNNGTLNVFDATMQNQAANADTGSYCGAINCGDGAVTTLRGATIQNIASNDGGTVVYMQNAAKCVLNIQEGTKIINNYGGWNASIIRLYGTDTVNMTGGEISNNICEFGGSVVYLFDGCTWNMSGGKINDNWASGYGEIYVHSGSTLNITGGEICGNDNYLPAIYVRSSNNKVSISGCLITGNTTDYSESYKPYNSFYCNSTYPIVCHNLTGGVYSQDVGKYCPAGYVCIPYDSDVSDYCDISYLPDGYDEDTDDADYIIVPGYKVSYYVLETNAETGEATRNLVHTEFLLIPADMTAEEAELKAAPYVHTNDDETQMIDEWYTDVEMANQFDYDTEITKETGNIELYGAWRAIDGVAEIVETGKQYPSIAAAVNAAKTGETIKVLKDHEIDVSELTQKSVVFIDGSKIEKLTIDFNGKTVTANTGDNTSGNVWTIFYARFGANVTFTGDGNVNIVGDDANRPYLFWASASTITVEDGTYIMDGSLTQGAKNGAVSHTFYASSGGHIYVKNGYYGNIDSVIDLMNIYDGSGSTITVTGGTYTEYFPDTDQPWEVTVPEGYTIIDNGNGTWSVNPYITVIFDDQTMKLNGRVPELTYTIDYGYLDEEVVGVQVKVTGIKNPNAGKHEITGTVTLTDGTGDADNYAVVIIPGTLTVNSAKPSGGGSSGGGGGGGYFEIEDEETPLAGVPSVFTTEHVAYVDGKDGYVKPEEYVTRAEVAEMFYRLLNDETLWAYRTSENNFPDVNKEDWFNEAVSTIANMGILQGAPDGNFYPNAYITRAEFATILARFDFDPTVELGAFPDAVNHWAEAEICMAADKGWFEGNDEGDFCPANNLTRAEIVTVINRVVGRNPKSAEDLIETMTVWEDNKDTSKWYYLAIQEATNGHSYGRREDESEYWTDLK